jgi:hypothetical protein
MPVRLDGTTVRGARDAAGHQRHLLAALAGRTAQCPVVAAQAGAGVKTNQVPMAAAVLGQIDLNGTVVTAGALPTVKATAEFICEGGGEFAVPVKENRKALLEALDALSWHQVAVAHPAAERHVTALDGTPRSDVAALGVTTLTATRAGPARLAGLVRGHRAIESLHWLRDTLYREDQSQVRTRSGPWPRSGTSPSAPSAWPGGTTPPKPPAGPAGPRTGPSPSPDSHHGRETAVPAGARRPQACGGHTRDPSQCSCGSPC